MNSNQPSRFHKVLAIVILVGLVAGLVGIVWWIAGVINRLTATELVTLLTVVIPVLAAVVTAAATVYAVARSKSADRDREIQQELRKRKGPIYEEFTQFVIGKVLRNEASEEAMKAFVIKFSQEMVVWGDDDVIHAWAIFKRASGDADGIRGLIAMEDILFAIRRSMGHRNKMLNRGDLLSLFVNDVHAELDRHRLSTSENNPTDRHL